MTPPEKYISIEELAEFLSVRKSTLYGLVQILQIPHYRIGRLIRFKIREVEKWMEGNKQEIVKVPYEKIREL